MKLAVRKQQKKIRRSVRVRAKILGTQAVPRLSVARSAKHISAQLINDAEGITVAHASDHDLKEHFGKPVSAAKEVGKMLAERAKAVGVESAVFDRGSFRYHGRVAALAEGAREGGLKF